MPPPLQQPARDILAELISYWCPAVLETTAGQLAWAIRAVRIPDEERFLSQSVELVWTGPVSGQSTLRRTEQALLEVIESAHRSLILVTFAGYKVPQVTAALQEAARRGVEIHFIAETPDASDGKVLNAAFQALGESLAQQLHLLIWPKDQRKLNSAGQSGALHAKCAVADDRIAFISSANLTGHALEMNMELGVLIRGGDMPCHIAEHFRSWIHGGILKRLPPSS